uniref:Protein kinase domain-containing protein n=1 Tax=Plectus sambesii TaxID=2011161 RepID=A0A914X4R6_9BILA
MAASSSPIHHLPPEITQYRLTNAHGYVKTSNHLGEGGFGTVLLYKNSNAPFDEAAGKHLKISPNQATTEFFDELAPLCAITRAGGCEYIAPFLGYIDSPELVILTKYFKNKSLWDEMKDVVKGPFPPERSLKYFYQIAKGLEFLHHDLPERKRILHRDLKCQNILLSDDTESIKLADFGLAFNLAVDSHSVTLSDEAPSEENSMCGTFAFMAPEVLIAKKYGRRSDIWSLACTLVQMLTMKPPYFRSAKEFIEKARGLKSNQLKYKGNLFLPQQLQNTEISVLLDCMFIKNPDQRPMVEKVLEVLTIVQQSPLKVGIDNAKVNELKTKIGKDKGISVAMFEKIFNWIACY